METTGLDNAYAVQIAAVDRAGTVVFNKYVRPNAAIEPAAVAVHGITPERLAQAPVFGELLPGLTDVFHGRVAVRWEDAMVPYAVWRGLWSVKRGAYRSQPLGGPHDAVADARLLMAKLEQMAATPSTSPW